MKFSPQVRNLLKAILRFTGKRKIYIVGGYLRDSLLERDKENLDIDFCLKKGAIGLGEMLSKRIKAGFVVLDRAHGACRLVKKINGKTYTLDFTDFRGATLEEDLLHRDFTINALALELKHIPSLSKRKETSMPLEDLIIDPYSGRKDLKARLIKKVDKKAFIEDPLRILRAFSFSSYLAFKIDKDTLESAGLNRKRLDEVAAERLRDELFRLFDSADSFTNVVRLDELGMIKIVFPEFEKMRGVNQGPYHHLDVWQHTLQTLRQLELLIKELKSEDTQNYLDEIISYPRRRRALIKLAALLHDVGKPSALRRENGKLIFHGHERIGWEIAEEIAKRLKLSNDELAVLRRMVICHLRPGYLADNEVITPRAIFRYFRDADTESVSTLLLSVADQRSTRGRLTTKDSRLHHEKIVFNLIKEYFRRKKEKKPLRLVNGDDLIKEFKLQPSRLIGRILSELEELQAIGKIKTKGQAFSRAAGMIKKKEKHSPQEP